MPPRHCDPTFDNDFGYAEHRQLHHALDDEDERVRQSPTQPQVVLLSPSNQPNKKANVQRVSNEHFPYQPLVDDNKIRWRDSRHRRIALDQVVKPILPLTISLPILNLIDMTAVALVVPLLIQYYKAAGVASASQRELLSSIYSSSQIAGGLLLGALSDAGWLRRRTLLLLSFGGSAVSYFMIASSHSNSGGGLTALVVSRVLVGLVKQTMTVTTSLLTKCTTKENRAAHMGRLTASSTVAWVIGPSVGAILYKYVDNRAPAFVASLLFVVNIILALILLPADHAQSSQSIDSQSQNQQSSRPLHTIKSLHALGLFWNNLQSCFGSWNQGSVIVSLLLFTWVSSATSFASLGSFYEDMYGLQPHHCGYLSSYQQILGLTVQSLLVAPVLKYGCGGCERRAACWSALLLAAATMCELKQSLSFFLLVLCPAISLSIAMMNLSLRSLITQVAPPESVFSILAVLDVLQNASAVTVPMYRTWLMSVLPNKQYQNEPLQDGVTSGMIQGDPDPAAWVVASSLHWLVAAALICYCLLSTPSRRTKVN